MPLDTDALSTALETTFNDAKDNAWSTDAVAAAIAAAIADFVKSGDVVGVTVDVTDLADLPLGTGTQTGTGQIE